MQSEYPRRDFYATKNKRNPNTTASLKKRGQEVKTLKKPKKI
jgi:hypothetical protein